LLTIGRNTIMPKKRKRFSDGLSEPRRHKPYEGLKHISGPKPKPAREVGAGSRTWQAPEWIKKLRPKGSKGRI